MSGLAIMVWSCDLTRPELLATPFMTAQAAAALDMPVTMLFTNQAAAWLLRENAGRLTGFGDDRRSVARHLDATVELGVEIRACSQALSALGAAPAALAPQCAGVEGMVTFVERASAPGWRLVVF